MMPGQSLLLLPDDAGAVAGLREAELPALPHEPLGHVDAGRLLRVRELGRQLEQLRLVLTHLCE